MDKWLNFVYNIKIKGYTNFGSDIRKLYAIVSKRLIASEII